MKRDVSMAEAFESPPKVPSAISQDARESQLIALAMDLVEQRLRNGTATSQETVHFLRLGSMREQMERQKLENENILLKAKTQALESQARMEELYAAAIAAMRKYNGDVSHDEDEEDDEYY